MNNKIFSLFNFNMNVLVEESEAWSNRYFLLSIQLQTNILIIIECLTNKLVLTAKKIDSEKY